MTKTTVEQETACFVYDRTHLGALEYLRFIYHCIVPTRYKARHLGRLTTGKLPEATEARGTGTRDCSSPARVHCEIHNFPDCNLLKVGHCEGGHATSINDATSVACQCDLDPISFESVRKYRRSSRDQPVFRHALT